MANRNLVIFGASSPTGQLIVRRALEQGWRVTIYGRRTLDEHAGDENIKSIQGRLDDEDALAGALRGQDAVISVIGPSGPFAPTDIIVTAYRLILRTMKKEGVSRILALSTFSVYDPKDKPSFPRWALVTLLWVFLHRVWRCVVDVARVFDTDGEGIDWTLFRVGFLGSGPGGKVIDGYVGDGKMSNFVQRADIAAWTIDQAAMSPPQHVHEKPGICTIKI